MNPPESENVCRQILAVLLKAGEGILMFEHNEHKSSYMTAAQELETPYFKETVATLPQPVFDNMCARDSIWTLCLGQIGTHVTQKTAASDLNELLSLCALDKVSSEHLVDAQLLEDFRWLLESKYVTLSIDANDHLYCCETAMSAEEYLDDREFAVLAESYKREMIDSNSIWFLSVYPNTPIGSYRFYRSTLKEVLRDARETLGTITANNNHPWSKSNA